MIIKTNSIAALCHGSLQMPINQLPKKKKQKKQPKTYGQKEVDFSEILPLPDGYEKLFLAIYFVTIPYAAGLIFLFIFVAHGRIDNFLSLDIAMFVAVWAIGYEIVGSLSLIIIFYKMYNYNKMMRQKERNKTSVRAEKHHNNYEIHKFS